MADMKNCVQYEFVCYILFLFSLFFKDLDFKSVVLISKLLIYRRK